MTEIEADNFARLFTPAQGQRVVLISGVKSVWGMLGNMSPYPVQYAGTRYRTAEHLFQALRFRHDSPVQEVIRGIPSPMIAKRIAKKAEYAADRVVEACSPADVDNMRLVLGLKFEQNLADAEFARHMQILKNWNGPLIVEDCTARPRGSGMFWGARLVDLEKNLWEGENRLGRLWSELLDSWAPETPKTGQK